MTAQMVSVGFWLQQQHQRSSRAHSNSTSAAAGAPPHLSFSLRSSSLEVMGNTCGVVSPCLSQNLWNLILSFSTATCKETNHGMLPALWQQRSSPVDHCN